MKPAHQLGQPNALPVGAHFLQHKTMQKSKYLNLLTSLASPMPSLSVRISFSKKACREKILKTCSPALLVQCPPCPHAPLRACSSAQPGRACAGPRSHSSGLTHTTCEGQRGAAAQHACKQSNRAETKDCSRRFRCLGSDMSAGGVEAKGSSCSSGVRVHRACAGPRSHSNDLGAPHAWVRGAQQCGTPAGTSTEGRNRVQSLFRL
jgi:hypothetical protein